jgi:hypothetical protein
MIKKIIVGRWFLYKNQNPRKYFRRNNGWSWGFSPYIKSGEILLESILVSFFVLLLPPGLLIGGDYLFMKGASYLPDPTLIAWP